MFAVIDRAAAAAAAAGVVSTHDGPVHVYAAVGSHFCLRVTVQDGRSAGVQFRVSSPACRPLEFSEDTDLYPVTGPKFEPPARELALDFAAWIVAFAERRLLVGCRSGGMVLTVPLHEQRLIARRGRFLSTAKRVALTDEKDDFADLVPVQEWPPGSAS